MSNVNQAELVVLCTAESVQPTDADCKWYKFDKSMSCKHLSFIMGQCYCHSTDAIKELINEMSNGL